MEDGYWRVEWGERFYFSALVCQLGDDSLCECGELLRPFTRLETRSDCGAWLMLQPQASTGRLSDSSLCTSESNCGLNNIVKKKGSLLAKNLCLNKHTQTHTHIVSSCSHLAFSLYCPHWHVACIVSDKWKGKDQIRWNMPRLKRFQMVSFKSKLTLR